MKIRNKFLLIVLPLIIASLLLVGLAAALSARNGITRVATEFLNFKADELKNYAATQWNLLVENDLSAQPEFVQVSKLAVESFARSLIRGQTELILALDGQGVAMSTSPVDLSAGELARLQELRAAGQTGWQQLTLGGQERVAQAAVFEPFGWYLLVTELRSSFYRAVEQIFWQSGTILVATLGVALLLLVLFTRYVTQPLGNVVAAMKEIISTNDLSRRVELTYRDETGELGHTFNLMSAELERAYNQIKSYAFKAVVAQRQERKIRSTFEKYVPAKVIDEFIKQPEAMLVGRDDILPVLFSDIRNFTRMSEQLQPEDLVDSLNAYFALMVDRILEHNGTVDKYIGDSIMAFWGAPVKHEDDVPQAVRAGLDMLDSLGVVNERQGNLGRPLFRIGIGITYGRVTVGNVGCEKKMDYTVMGPRVNLASRLESLTKVYDVPFVVDEAIYTRVNAELPCRFVDKVMVVGSEQGLRIYNPRRELTQAEATAWELHESAVELYYAKQFEEAARRFTEAQQHLPEDPILAMFLRRCRQHIESPPPADWDGTEHISEK